MPNMMDHMESGNFWLGLGTAVTLSIFGPTFCKAVKPLAVKGVQGIIYVSDKSDQFLHTCKKEMDEFVKSSQASNGSAKKTDNMQEFQQSITEKINQLLDQNTKSSEEINRLQEELQQLRNHFQELKPNEN